MEIWFKGLERLAGIGRETWRSYRFRRPSMSLRKQRRQTQQSQLMSHSETAVNSLFWKAGEEQQQQPTTFFLDRPSLATKSA